MGTRAVKVRRVTAISLVSFGGVITFLAVLLLIGTYRQDVALNSRAVGTTAEVVSVAFDRTLVRYQTPDGAVHLPPDGISFPKGLQVGQIVQVEYDAAHPDVVKVAGRGAYLALLPVGTLLLFLWLVIVPVVWWLRRATRSPSPATS
ncbi:DUF3592 domain-containing protein [Actinocrispum wychmicini]|uniref:DUF3592 domain-containing protein n=1 Tax=Actinocrispum wychmicini TaxID=1213861 RepID=UPI001049FB92|nr:DUF3592 domain-containing protein [Actinocrispum wychmicini]